MSTLQNLVVKALKVYQLGFRDVEIGTDNWIYGPTFIVRDPVGETWNLLKLGGASRRSNLWRKAESLIRVSYDNLTTVQVVNKPHFTKGPQGGEKKCTARMIIRNPYSHKRELAYPLFALGTHTKVTEWKMDQDAVVWGFDKNQKLQVVLASRRASLCWSKSPGSTPSPQTKKSSFLIPGSDSLKYIRWAGSFLITTDMSLFPQNEYYIQIESPTVDTPSFRKALLQRLKHYEARAYRWGGTPSD